MGITVNWNGTETTITGSNAYAIYEDWVQGEIDLSTSQIKMCESFLTDEEIDEIEYNNGGDEKTGAASINTEGTEDGNSGVGTAGTATGVAAVTGGTILGVVTSEANTAEEGQPSTATNGFCSLGVSLVCWAGAALALASVFSFDTALDDRKSRSEESDTTNSTLDGYTSSLEENFDAMNEDADAYAEATDTYTTMVNENVSKKADLQVQLQAAQAAGDTALVESLQSEIEACDEESEEITTDEIDEIQENMETYGSLSSEAIGASGSGQSVAEFLKGGKTLGPIATTCAVLAGLCTIYLGILSTIGGIPKLAPLFPDTGAALSSKLIWMACALTMGVVSTKMATTAKTEFECGGNGDKMQGHVNTLNDMIGEHSEYMEATTESYEETDEESQESQQEAVEAAAEVTANGGTVSTSGSTSDDEDEKKTAV